ncbi:hypothetical protein NHX12_018614 [Muraenolepis orangiensis]|uniref:Uncharacterized protein n=1 Tax=Muraenolepis orangiensis TaxID=630683 RepID=A0A9Q0EZT2_9TELE|nr:hypothetical protein NHX12_018614 [Muraenolepis orangiensis]
MMNNDMMSVSTLQPVAGTIGDIASSINAHLANAYTAAGADKTLVIFDSYNDEPSAKDHERRRRAGVGATEYKLTLNTPLPGREAVMKSTSNKTQLLRLLCTYDLITDKILLVNHMDRIVKHEEADITLISYMLEAARAGAPTLRILSDDTVVFILLVYWAWKANVQSAVQMEKWDGTILDINASIRTLGDKCQGLLGMHTGCDAVSYPCGKGKASALKLLQGNTGIEFFLALYGQKKAKSVNNAHYQVYSRRKKPPELKKPPPTDVNVMLHILRAHLQVSEPPAEARDITTFGWEVAK